MKSVFADVAPWPNQAEHSSVTGHNNPPLEEQVLMTFEEELERQGITDRVAELLASAERCPLVIQDDQTAGKVGDLCRLARDVEKRVNDAREQENRPLLNAQRSLKGKADGVIAPLLKAVGDIRMRLNAYVAKKEAEAAAERRRQEEEARKAREAMERAGVDQKLVETVTAPPPVAKGPVARGDLGSTVGTTIVWNFEIESMRQVPDRYLQHAKVKEALESVIRTAIRTEKVREIKGVRIWEGTQAVVR